MNWKKGYSASYYLKTVDPATWRDIDTYNIISGSVSRSDGALKESASLEMNTIPEGVEAWVRIYIDAAQGTDGERQAIFTGLMSTPANDWEGLRKSHSCECYSVLKPADDVRLKKGFYVPAGFNGAQAAADLLKGYAPVEYADGAPCLASSIIAENNETQLTMAEKIIDAIGWRIRISGDGTISIQPQDTEPRAYLDTLENDIVELDVTDTRDYFSCPNVFRATSGDLTAIARDDDQDSPLSTISRGREVWKEETSCKLNENESIAQYAMRRLKEEQAPSHEASYVRRFLPDLTVGDAAGLNFPAQGISGTFRITSQKIDLGYGARTSEEAIEI